MRDRASKTFWLVPAAIAVGPIAGPGPKIVLGQAISPRAPVSTTDAYGNARPPYRDRRRLDAFQNETQRLFYRGYQDLGRRVDRRGGGSSFSLLGDPRGTGRFGLGSIAASPFTISPRPGSGSSAFRPLGNFGARLNPTRPVNLDTVLQRRRDLVLSRALTAPIQRALLRSGLGLSLRSAVARTPTTGLPQPADTGSEQRIDRWLRAGVGVAHDRLYNDAWAWFRAGRYRRAARAFEAATLLGEDDVRSRVGELFSHLSLGASRTALAVLKELNRRRENPFVADLNVMDNYPNPKDGERIRDQVALPTAVGAADVDRVAMYVMVLWYLGDRDGALSAALPLARDSRHRSYAAWPALIREARAEREGDGGPHMP